MRSQKIPLGEICYETRDDIQLRTYVLLNRDRKTWINFLKGCNQFGISPRSYEDFLDLYQDIRVEGVKTPVSVQLINGKYYVEDGAHRIAVARALGHSTIEAYVVTNCGIPSVFIIRPKTISVPFSNHIDQTNPRIIRIFEHIDDNIAKNISSLKISTDTNPVPMKGTAILWPTCKHLWEEILEDIKSFHTVSDTFTLSAKSEDDMKNLTKELYKSDDVALWKVEAKFPYFMSRKDLDYLAIYFTIDDARHRIKSKTGNEISMAIEDLKSFIRKKYRPLVKDYPQNGQPDLIIHAGDNEYQTSEIRATSEKYRA